MGGISNIRAAVAMGSRRELFLRIFEDFVIKEKGEDGVSLCDMMASSWPFFTACLDSDGITGIQQWLPRMEFERFLAEELRQM
jgi:hypothetical protein